MPTKVGDTLSYKGRQYVVVGIEQHVSQKVAHEDALLMEANLKQQSNVRWLKMEIAHFEENDIINIRSECVILQSGQQDTQFVYTYYQVEKERSSGQNERKADVDQTAGTAAQANDGRPAGGPGAGGPRPG